MNQPMTDLTKSEVPSAPANEVQAINEDPLHGQPLVEIERDGRHYTLLGTAHVSKASVAAVQHLVSSGQYDAIAVELDTARHQALTQPEAFRELDLLKVIKDGKVGQVAANLALSAYQRRLAEQLGVEPGAELKAASVGAANTGKPLWLIDRAVGMTLRRATAGLGFWKRTEMLTGVVMSLITREKVEETEIEALKQGDMLQSTFSEFAQNAPALYQGLIAERDSYMAAQLRTHANQSDARKILAVVGAGHLDGLSRELRDSPAEPAQTIANLDLPPPPSIWPKLFGWAIMAVLVGGVVWGFSKGFSVGTEMLLVYLGFTAAGALLGAVAGGAHPLSAIAAGASAPLTVLHPLLAAGMFSAATELWLRRPRVADFQALRDDLATMGGWWRNRVSRILLIFILTNFGTMIAVWITTAEFFRRFSSAG
jgi:pheromone shutdown-related protein TraB